MSSNIARGDILRAGIINHFLPLLRALLECGFYSREGFICGNTVYTIMLLQRKFQPKDDVVLAHRCLDLKLSYKVPCVVVETFE